MTILKQKTHQDSDEYTPPPLSSHDADSLQIQVRNLLVGVDVGAESRCICVFKVLKNHGDISLQA